MEEFELEPGEVIIHNVRQHIFVLALNMLPLLLLAFVPLVFSGVMDFVTSTSPQLNAAYAGFHIPASTQRFLVGIWLLGIWTSAFSMFTRYYLTVWVITNMRIVDIRQYGFFNREVSSFLLDRLQDITTGVSGFLGTLIGYGRLSLETAGKDESFYMDTIPNPEAIRDEIMAQVARIHQQPGGAAE